jgi:LCP family protein required for cell wall assembly
LLMASDHQTVDDLADTIMVIHIEPQAKRTLVVSFPRDLWVNIPGRGMAKINAASANGPDLLIQTLKADFNIDINHFIFMDFKAFEGVVNAIGTVPVYFPYPARDSQTGLTVSLGGCVPLDGLTALEYTRSRALEFLSFKTNEWIPADSVAPDIGRIARQQQFIRELAGIAVQRSLDDPLTANSIADKAISYLTFDNGLSKDDLLGIIDAFRTVNTSDQSHLEFETLPWQAGPNQGAQSVVYVRSPDDQILLARLRDFSAKNAGPSVPPGSVRVSVVDGTGRPGTGQGALDDLVRRGGFVAGGAASSLGIPAAHTEVRYRPGAAAKGGLVLEYLQPQARLVEDPTIGTDVSVVLGQDFRNIVIPLDVTGGHGSSSPAAAATPPTTAPSTGLDTNAQTSNGSVDPAIFGTPVAKTPPCR